WYVRKGSRGDRSVPSSTGGISGVVQPLHMQPGLARYKSGARNSACIAPGLKAQLPIKHHDPHGAGTLGPLLILPTLVLGAERRRESLGSPWNLALPSAQHEGVGMR